MKNKKPKVFLGTNNVASVFDGMQLYFRQFGWDTYTIVLAPNHAIITGEYDEIISEKVMSKKLSDFLYLKPRKSIVDKLVYRALRLITQPLTHFRKQRILNQAIKECDLFVFLWSSLDRKFKDYEKIKKANKKIAIIFCGDDARWHEGITQEFSKLQMPNVTYDASYDTSIKSLQIRLNRIKQAERYADFLFNKREQAQICLRPFHHYPMITDVEEVLGNVNQREENPIVVHAPSNSEIKGTKFVLEAFEKLKTEGVLFESVLLQNVNHEDAMKIYQTADIVIDQLFIPGAGKLASEALSCGAVVMSFMAYDKYYQAEYYKESPIVDVNQDTLYAKLKELILDPEQRKKLAKKSRPYAIKHLHTKVFVQNLIRQYEGEEIPYDYTPTFFRDTFIPESAETTAAHNEYLHFVKNCDWYKKNVQSGVRDGLQF